MLLAQISRSVVTASMTRDRDRRGAAQCIRLPGDKADRNALTW
ncbi:hypothetical protein AVDCRST_MAG94-978 [uncultured Leptolyngbya sp.]|uniref:Uncharacterized protein n=1 Tax=uncultured Leptolyngbya sp. TaxID=332963 RepID=A0A6J4KPG3_9CYAN|nr:hypothetical protein AVDCRST_MAG94-978 [uncultured Leptolyngbya sp.]